MNDDKLHNIIDSINYFLTFRKGYWMHDKIKVSDQLELKYVSESIKVDKEMAEKIKSTVVRECKLTTSILSPSKTTANRNKSVKEIVAVHIDNKYLLKLDINHYFESIKYGMVEKILEKSELPMWFVEKFYFADGILRRGLHASSFIAEIIGSKIDNAISRVLHEQKCHNVIYTRYCDDILLSCNDREALRIIEQIIECEFQRIGFSLNRDKSKLVHTHTASILGLHIHNGEIIVPKRFKKRARIRVHYANMMYDKCNMDDESSIDMALKAVGSAIGSLQYIINNSSSRDTILKSMLARQTLYSRLSELEEARDLLREDENPVSNGGLEEIFHLGK